MANANQVIVNGKTILDLRSDTVTPETLQKGYTAHDKSGAKITGTLEASSVSVQPSKRVIITSNGTVSVTPDAPYDALASASVTVYVPGVFPNGTEWTESNVTSGDFSSVVNANGLWVAASLSNEGILYSTDGKIWESSNLGQAGNFEALAYANGLWVAGSSDDQGIYYSDDGKMWYQTSKTSGIFKSFVNSNGLWVAGSDTGIYYSTDGKTWDQSDMVDGVTAVANANGVWVAGSDTGIYYSFNGENWMPSDTSVDGVTAVANANGVWVMCDVNGGFYYSTDGIVWDQSNITAGSGGWVTSLVNANGLWVVGHDSGIYYSFNGKMWYPSDMPPISISKVAYANGIWVSCTESNNGIYYSDDGKMWAQSDITSGSFEALAYANGLWVAGGSGQYSNGLYYSVSWEPY